jgi:hypothetical protein
VRYLLLAAALSWCGPVTDAHHETAEFYGGAVEAAQAMECAEPWPSAGVLRCDVYNPYGEPIEMWCDAARCEYVIP